MNIEIEDVIIRELKRYTDHRGWLIELFRQDELDKELFPVMSYISETKPGIARGPHEHVDQTDYFGFIGPSDFDLYLWDNRENSPTYKKKVVVRLGSSKPAVAIVPPGVVHAYRNVGDVPGIVFNAPNRLFAGEGKKELIDEIRHEDDSDSQFKLDD
ncbi:MAG: dTDP-4-dehydrorhamnose 3,5-epimerase family protein [Calditrichaceae bacterium]|nr:dTDP-4-dehydrorhamnose 3,5-epimerase family protein [Calditrichaceae bacterium]